MLWVPPGTGARHSRHLAQRGLSIQMHGLSTVRRTSAPSRGTILRSASSGRCRRASPRSCRPRTLSARASPTSRNSHEGIGARRRRPGGPRGCSSVMCRPARDHRQDARGGRYRRCRRSSPRSTGGTPSRTGSSTGPPIRRWISRRMSRRAPRRSTTRRSASSRRRRHAHASRLLHLSTDFVFDGVGESRLSAD